jgi:hypothetical protein
VAPDDLLERGIGTGERLRDEAGFGNAIEIDPDG